MITLNEELRLPAFLDAWSAVADRVVVVDGGSQDRTCAIARERGAQVLNWQGNEPNFAAQKNAGLAAIEAGWIFVADADEHPDSELIDYLHMVKRSWAQDIAHEVRIITYVGSRAVASSAQWQPRLVPANAGKFVGSIHERFECTYPIRRLRASGILRNYSFADWPGVRTKTERYAKLEASALAPTWSSAVRRLGVLGIRACRMARWADCDGSSFRFIWEFMRYDALVALALARKAAGGNEG